jgi:hypothetical protein
MNDNGDQRPFIYTDSHSVSVINHTHALPPLTGLASARAQDRPVA